MATKTYPLKLTNTEELKDLIASQNDQITALYRENNSLKQQNEILEKDLLEVQESTLQLKVDITGIPESSYETYDQLHTKIAKIMMPTCEGMTDEVKWDTSINIPLSTCERLGPYSQNMKRVVRITFLFMKHKQCLLQRWRELPHGSM